MEIRINKEAQERQQREELNRVIVRAKTYANAGVELFDFKRQKAIGLSPFELIQSSSFFSTSISCYLFHGLLDFHVKYVL